jgi:sarcosine oxidase subunit gamma
MVEGDLSLIDSLNTQPRSYGVYPVVRQDAALALSGPRLQDLLRQICSVNLAHLSVGNSVVLTSMAGVGAIVLAEQQTDEIVFRFWFDGTYGNYLWHTLSGIANELNSSPTAFSQLP